jgi:hypothetical protein
MTAELPLEQSEKYPLEDLDLAFNFSRDLPRGVTISGVTLLTATTMGNVPGSMSSDITVTPGSPAYSGKKAFASYLGGTAGETYILKCRITRSDNGKPLEIHGKLYIKAV